MYFLWQSRQIWTKLDLFRADWKWMFLYVCHLSFLNLYDTLLTQHTHSSSLRFSLCPLERAESSFCCHFEKTSAPAALCWVPFSIDQRGGSRSERRFWLWGEKSARRDCGREMTRDLFPLYTYYCFNSHHRYRCLLMLWDAAYSKLCYDHGFSSCIFFLKIILMCQCYHTIRCLLWNTRTELGRKQISWILDSLSFHCITRAVIFCIF